MSKKVLMVTGASKGIGLEVVLKGLEAGYNVVGTSRSASRLTESVLSRMPEAKNRFLALEMNFDEASIKAAISRVMEHFGSLDVLVNNAGYAILGAVEEFSVEEVKTNFDVNVFGLLSVMQAVLPYMRQAKSGHIINLASISGTITGPAQGVYSATKAAVIMLSEALKEEVAPFNIQVTAICPGGVRTDFLDHSSMKKPVKEIPSYHLVKQTMQGLGQLNHNQSGDPSLVAQAIIRVAEMAEAPARLYLGGGALAGLQHKIEEVVQEANLYTELSLSTDRKE